MPYNIIAVRSADETGAAMYPVLSDDGDPMLVALEEADGRQIERVTGSGLIVSELRDNQRHRIGKLEDVDIEVYVTDARLVVACAKYAKGGGWHGGDYTDIAGMALAGVANAVSRARVARKRRGNCLVGHIRYPWLVKVGSTSRQGIGTTNALRLQIQERTTNATSTRTLLLEITLDKRTNAPALAQQIARRCARFHLARDITPGSQHHAAYQALTSVNALSPEKKTFAFHNMPNHFYAVPATAYPSRQDVTP